MTKQTISFSVPFVKPKKRPEHTYKNGRWITYTPNETKEFEAQIALLYTLARGKLCKKEVSVEVDIQIQRHHKKLVGEVDNLGGWRTCDVDNVAKLVLDALNGVAYPDDRQVQRLNVCKLPLAKGTKDDDFMRVEISFEEKDGTVSEPQLKG